MDLVMQHHMSRPSFSNNIKSQLQGRRFSTISSALPETSASVAVASTLVGAAATLLVKRTKTSESTQLKVQLKLCEDCGGSGICSECSGIGFLQRTSMAVVVRCRCFRSHPPFPQPQFSAEKPHLSGKFACLSFKVDKFAPFLKVTCDGSPEIPSMVRSSKCKENIQQRFSSLIFLASNILIFFAPSKALAETCEADNSIFNMPILLAVALIGATVGGLLARQRRGELQRVNEQLLQINAALRKQAKIESYAPSLSYAPIGGRILDNDVIIDPKKQELISKLKNGKNFLRNQQPDKAFTEFKIALELAQNLRDPIEEKKAARGLGASLQRQGKYRDSIKYHSMVLAISEREGEDSGNTEAFGAIADCYTELGDLEKAGQFYDKYIARLEKD